MKIHEPQEISDTQRFWVGMFYIVAIIGGLVIGVVNVEEETKPLPPVVVEILADDEAAEPVPTPACTCVDCKCDPCLCTANCPNGICLPDKQSTIDLMDFDIEPGPQPTPAAKPKVLGHPFIAEDGYAMRKHVLVFSSKQCGPCRQMIPAMHRWIDNDGVKLYIFYPNVQPTIFAEFGIDRYPTFVFMDEGDEVTRFIGASVYGVESILDDKGYR